MMKFIFFFIIFAPTIIFANDKVDYDKPFDQIKNSSFEVRHSLMDKKFVEDVKPVSNVADVPVIVDKVNEDKSVVATPVAPVNILKNIDEMPDSEDAVILKRPQPKVLKPDGYDEIMKAAFAKSEELNSNNIKSNIIDESSKSVISKPLFEKKEVKKSDLVEVIEDANIGQAIAHVASYKTEETAVDGILALEKKYPQTGIFEPYVNYENVPGKGKYYRLYFIGDKRELEYLCRAMKKNNDWCLVKGV